MAVLQVLVDAIEAAPTFPKPHRLPIPRYKTATSRISDERRAPSLLTPAEILGLNGKYGIKSEKLESVLRSHFRLLFGKGEMMKKSLANVKPSYRLLAIALIALDRSSPDGGVRREGAAWADGSAEAR